MAFELSLPVVNANHVEWTDATGRKVLIKYYENGAVTAEFNGESLTVCKMWVTGVQCKINQALKDGYRAMPTEQTEGKVASKAEDAVITLPTRLRLTASVADGEPRRYNLRLPESHCVLRLAELRSVAELGKIQHNITATIPHCPKGYDFTVAAIEAFVGVDLPTLAAASRYDGFVQLLTECCALEVNEQMVWLMMMYLSLLWPFVLTLALFCVPVVLFSLMAELVADGCSRRPPACPVRHWGFVAAVVWVCGPAALIWAQALLVSAVATYPIAYAVLWWAVVMGGVVGWSPAPGIATWKTMAPGLMVAPLLLWCGVVPMCLLWALAWCAATSVKWYVLAPVFFMFFLAVRHPETDLHAYVGEKRRIIARFLWSGMVLLWSGVVLLWSGIVVLWSGLIMFWSGIEEAYRMAKEVFESTFQKVKDMVLSPPKKDA